MAFQLPDRVPLARLPTPVTRLERLSKKWGVDLWVKHDELTGAELSGNKVRKLEFELGEARRLGAGALITCGGAQSNHARATAIVARRAGLVPHLVLRTTDGRPVETDGNVLLDRILGAEITWVTREQYRDSRMEIMRGIADRLKRERGLTAMVIPEGASDAVGSMGYVAAVDEILAQVAAGELPKPAWIVHGCGSGGTSAGLAIGAAMRGEGALKPLAIAVCDDVAYFENAIGAIVRDAAARFGSPAEAPLTILDRWKGVGYAMNTREELDFLREVAETEGVILDPVYSVKAFRGLREEARAGRFGKEPVLFVHTGGIYGLFPKKAEFGFASDILAT